MMVGNFIFITGCLPLFHKSISSNNVLKTKLLFPLLFLPVEPDINSNEDFVWEGRVQRNLT